MAPAPIHAIRARAATGSATATDHRASRELMRRHTSAKRRSMERVAERMPPRDRERKRVTTSRIAANMARPALLRTPSSGTPGGVPGDAAKEGEVVSAHPGRHWL